MLYGLCSVIAFSYTLNTGLIMSQFTSVNRHLFFSLTSNCSRHVLFAELVFLGISKQIFATTLTFFIHATIYTMEQASKSLN